jgi:hypothetical protein
MGFVGVAVGVAVHAAGGGEWDCSDEGGSGQRSMLEIHLLHWVRLERRLQCQNLHNNHQS